MKDASLEARSERLFSPARAQLRQFEQDDVPVLAGILLVRSAKMARFLNANIPGMRVPDEVVARLEGAADPLAEDGSALKLYNTHYEWCATLPFSKVAFDHPGRKYRLRMRVCVEKEPGKKGEALWAGVYDPKNKRGIGGIDRKNLGGLLKLGASRAAIAMGTKTGIPAFQRSIRSRRRNAREVGRRAAPSRNRDRQRRSQHRQGQPRPRRVRVPTGQESPR